MQRFVLRRLAQSVLLLFVLALVIFAMARVSGNPADLLLREDATQEDRAHFLHALGLEQNQLWYLHNGRNEKLTDFGGNVITKVFA